MQWVARLAPGNAALAVNQHAAIHVQRDAGAILGQVACQEHHAAGDVVGFANAAQRNGIEDGRALLLGDLALVDVGGDQARGDAVHTDVVGAELARHGLRQTEHTRLRG